MRSFLKKYRRLILGCVFLFLVIPCIPDAITSGVQLVKSFSKEPVRTLNIGEIQLGGDPIVASFQKGMEQDLARAIQGGQFAKSE